ncbi:hypothetical protein EVAR_80207_1 [Eumeta japonica]|uniref:Uncharacterized protein n=1 Tax=Eumeta variegata TaxID=151549 RepID=A0A4C1UB11_EUMVA|nr:hypothetical protein EVAR_80207_1 [Eumeta japonica]
MEVRYHKHCYRDYLRLPRNSETPAGRPANKIPHDILIQAFEKLMDEIKHQLTSNSFEVSFLAKRLAELTEIEDAVVENRVMKSLLIDKQMLPYFFSTNHTNYIRGVTLYLQDMMKLPLEVEDDMKRGMLSVKRTEGTFNGVSPDLALEQSRNRSSAVTGGFDWHQ